MFQMCLFFFPKRTQWHFPKQCHLSGSSKPWPRPTNLSGTWHHRSWSWYFQTKWDFWLSLWARSIWSVCSCFPNFLSTFHFIKNFAMTGKLIKFNRILYIKQLTQLLPSKLSHCELFLLPGHRETSPSSFCNATIGPVESNVWVVEHTPPFSLYFLLSQVVTNISTGRTAWKETALSVRHSCPPLPRKDWPVSCFLRDILHSHIQWDC